MHYFCDVQNNLIFQSLNISLSQMQRVNSVLLYLEGDSAATARVGRYHRMNLHETSGFIRTAVQFMKVWRWTAKVAIVSVLR